MDNLREDDLIIIDFNKDIIDQLCINTDIGGIESFNCNKALIDFIKNKIDCETYYDTLEYYGIPPLIQIASLEFSLALNGIHI